MPHATNEVKSTMNGDKSSSQFLDHITSYPVVSDSIETFKSNPYGKKSLELAGGAYDRFGKPVEPYLETPKSYVAPYAKRADELADSGLGKVETHFPIVKDDTNTIVQKGKSFVFYPFKLAGDSTNYVFSTYNDEYQKTAKHNGRGPGVTTFAMAVVSTELKIASDFFQAVADFLGPKYDESKQKGSELLQQAQDTAVQYKDVAQEKLQQADQIAGQKFQELKQQGQETAQEAQKKGEQTADQAKQTAKDVQKKGEQTADQAKQEAQRTKDEAQRKTQK